MSFLRAGVKDKFHTNNGETIREIIKADLTGVALTADPVYPQTAETVDLRSFEAYRTTQEEGETTDDEGLPTIEDLRRKMDREDAALTR